jgi:hypothetical protein
MSAINPASVINPAGNMQVQPPSAVGPGAIMHAHGGNASYAVGPGFGNNAQRPNQQYGKSCLQHLSRAQLIMLGRAPQQAPQTGYDDGYNAFSYQLQGYNPQANFQMTPWAGQGQRVNQQMYGNYPMQAGGYPNATASGSPMNYGGYYPPTTYGASAGYGAATGGPAYRGGYTSTAAASSSAPTTTAGPSYNQYANSYYKAATTTSSIPNLTGTAGSYGNGNGHAAASGSGYNAGYDPSLMAAMQNMSFNK